MVQLFTRTLFFLLIGTVAYSQSRKPIVNLVQSQQNTEPTPTDTPPLLRIESNLNAATQAVLANKYVKNPTLLSVNQAELAKLLGDKPASLQLALPRSNKGEPLLIDLVRVNIFGSDFKVITSAGETIKPTESELGLFYQGIIRGDTNSVAAISLLGDEISGLISSRSGNLVLGKVKNQTSHILYDDVNNSDGAFSCGTIDQPPTVKMGGGRLASPKNDYCDIVYVRVVCDYSVFVDKGASNVTTTRSYATGLFNQVAMLYRNEDIAIVLSEIYVWTSPDPYRNNPYPLDQIRDATGDNFNGNLNHFLTTIARTSPTGPINGVGYRDVLCTKAQAHALTYIHENIAEVPAFSQPVKTMAHELGHNFGSHHTHWCGWPGGAIDGCAPVEPDNGCALGPSPGATGGTIMSYCSTIDFALGFGQLPGNVIREALAYAQCTTQPYLPPTGLSVTNLQATKATLNWPVTYSNTQFQLQYRRSSSSTWVTSAATRATSRTLTGLFSNTTYVWRVFGTCGGYSQEVTFTTPAGGLNVDPIATELCSNQTIDVNLNTIDNYFNATNVFTVVLSNPMGSFSSGTTIIGSATGPILSGIGTYTGVITCALPQTSGSQFRVRVVTSNPATTSSDNGNDISINPSPLAPTIVTPNACSASVVSLTAMGCEQTVRWSDGSFGATLTVPAGATNVYYALCESLNGCQSLSATHQVQVSAAPTIAASATALCYTNRYVGLSVTNAVEGETFQWQANGVNVFNATSVTLLVDRPGTYTVVRKKIAGGSWMQSPIGSAISGLKFVNSTTGWAVGAGGKIYKTTNGGAQWIDQSPGTTIWFTAVYFLNTTTGWAVGRGGIFKTTNGGTNWSSLGETGLYNDVYFVDGSTGWIAGAGGLLKKTSDGGQTWSTQSTGTTNEIISIQFADANTGWLTYPKNIIKKTVNGGQSWQEIGSDDTFFFGSLYRLYFKNALKGWVAGYNTIRKTINGGANWNSQLTSPRDVSGIWQDVYFLNDQAGWLVGGGGIRQTNNGGATWTTQATSGGFSKLSFLDSGQGWAAQGATILSYTPTYSTSCASVTIGTTCCSYVSSIKSGSWNDPTVWSCGQVPISTDNVTINYVVTVGADVAATVKQLTFGPGGKLLYKMDGRLRITN